MPEEDEPFNLLRELRDVGVTPPQSDALHARVSRAVADEIQRGSDRNGASPGRSSRRPRWQVNYARATGVLVPAIGVLMVVLVVALFFGLHGSGQSPTAASHGSRPNRTAAGRDSVELVYEAEPTPEVPVVTRAALTRTVQIMQARLSGLGIGGARVSAHGRNEITVRLPKGKGTARAEREVGTTAQLDFYDWEANALTPTGKTVATQLQSQDPTALTISQGSGTVAPGDPSAGSMGLYQAVLLGSKQPYWAESTNSRITSQYWMFGTPGSSACATAARDQGTVPVAGEHCLLSGPDDSMESLEQGLLSGLSASQGQVLTIPRGWVLMEAIPANFSNPTPITDPSAQFYVLKDNIALRGTGVTNPRQSTNPGSTEADITFGFTSKGDIGFRDLTAQVARRGAQVSGLGESLQQHFAVALSGDVGQLITVPYIDYKQYPDGIGGNNGADISGGFSVSSARNLVNELRLGALPVNLTLICVRDPATAPCGASRGG